MSKWNYTCGFSENSGYSQRNIRFLHLNSQNVSVVRSMWVPSGTPKLSCLQNNKTRTTKSNIALYKCRKVIGKSWRLNPWNTKWIMDIVVKPKLMYGALVWCPAMKKSIYSSIFERVLRSFALIQKYSRKLCSKT